MEQRSSRLWASLFICLGLAALAGALADAHYGWLLGLAERLRGGGPPSAITVRALWVLRWWAFVAGAAGVAVFGFGRLALPSAMATLFDSSRFVLLSYLGLSAGMLSWTIPLGFLGDDFLWLDTWQRTGLGVLRPEPGSPHYIPLGLILANIPQALFGVEAAPYRLLTIVLHTVVGWCVARGALATGLASVVAWGAGAMFLTTTLAYEPLMWATGQFYLWPGVVIAAVLALVLGVHDRTPPLAIAAIALLSALCGFVIEQAAGLTLFVFLWALLHGRSLLSRQATACLLVVTLAGAFALMGFRGGSATPGDALQSFSGIARNITHMVGGLAIPNAGSGHMLGGWVGRSMAGQAAAVLVAGLATLWLSARGNTAIRTLVLAWWCLWLPAILFAQPTSRYWYLPSIPIAILLAHGIAALDARLRPGAVDTPGWATLLFPCAWALVGILAMGLRVQDWRHADRIARMVVKDTGALVETRPTVERLVLADVPDGVGTDLWPAYVYNNGLREAVNLARRWHGKEAWPGTVLLLEGPHRPWPMAYTGADPYDPSGELEIACLASDTLSAVYDAERGGLTPAECLLTE